MSKHKQLSIIYFVAAILIFWSCESNKTDNFGREKYDPSKPVEITSFEPDSVFYSPFVRPLGLVFKFSSLPL